MPKFGAQSILVALLLVEVVVFAFATERFASGANALEIVRSSCELGLLALATTLVLSTGGIDLSIGSVMGLVAVVLGGLFEAGVPLGVATCAGLLAGVVCGCLNGVVIAVAGVPPLLATLATMALFRGIAEGMSGGYTSVTGFPEGFLFLGQGYLAGVVPPQLPILVLAVGAAWLIAHRMPFGRRLSAIGHSPEAARHAGLPVVRDCIFAYTLSGLASAAAAVLYIAHLGQAKADAGTGYELAAITVAALGGTSIFGGVRSVPGTVLALFAVAVLQNGLLIAGLPSELASILLGVLLVSAVLLHGAAGASGWRKPRALESLAGGPLDMKNSQLAALIGAILVGALIIAASNAWILGRLEARATTSTGTPSETTRRPLVAMMPKNKSDPYFVSCRQGAEEAARELDLELTWDGPAETDAARQNEVVEAWITRGVDVMAVSVENAAAISTVLRKARARGIGVLTWDADAEADARDFLVNQATPQGIGEALADEAGRILGGAGRFAIVTASLTAANQNAWIESIRTRLAEAWPELEIAVIRPSDGLRDKALTETKNILRAHPDVHLIVTIAAAAVPGSAEAVKQEGRDDVKVIGLSVPSLCRDYVHEGIIESIVLWNTVDLGYLTVHACLALLDGRLRADAPGFEAGRLGWIDVQDGQVMLGRPFRFDASNIDDFDF
jgi:rhamnose transport system permease protein